MFYLHPHKFKNKIVGAAELLRLYELGRDFTQINLTRISL